MRRKPSIILIVSLIFSSSLLGQSIPEGAYYFIDSFNNKAISKSYIEIRKNSLVLRVTNMGDKSVQNRHLLFKGTIRKHKNFYIASLVLMNCDTCPVKQWRRQLKHPEKFNEVLSNKIDTTIVNGDTAYSQPGIAGTYVPVSLDRERMWIISVTENGDLRVDEKLYRRRFK